MGFEIEGGVEVVVIQILVLTPDGEDGYAMIDYQGRRDVVLRAEGVAGTKSNLRSPLLESQNKVGGLGGDVKTGRDPHPFQGFLLGKAFLDSAKDRHLPGRPVHAVLTL